MTAKSVHGVEQDVLKYLKTYESDPVLLYSAKLKTENWSTLFKFGSDRQLSNLIK